MSHLRSFLGFHVVDKMFENLMGLIIKRLRRQLLCQCIHFLIPPFLSRSAAFLTKGYIRTVFT